MGREYRLLRRSDLASIVNGPDPETAWIQAALRTLGLFGVACCDGETILGYALISPASHVPRGHPLYRAGDPAYAAMLALHSPEDDVEHQIARGLATTLAARLTPVTTVRGVEAKAAHVLASDAQPSAELLDAAGFSPRHNGGTWTLDLRRTLPVAEHIGRLRRRVAQVVLDPWRKPEPSSRRPR